MDTTVVYMIVSSGVHGSLSESELTRKTEGNTVFKNLIPLAFSEYNLRMNAADIGNQERTGWYSTEMAPVHGSFDFFNISMMIMLQQLPILIDFGILIISLIKKKKCFHRYVQR